MNLLDREVQEFIKKYEGATTTLLLKKPIFKELSNKELAQQIEGRRVAAKKLPFLLTEGILFPKGLNLEQSSSEVTAKYKAQELKGERFLDLTCGFGIDAFFLSEKFKEVTLVEQDEELLSKVQHNWHLLGRKANFINKAAEYFIKETTTHYDIIYLDPARRDVHKQKKFLLEDLSPNILELQPLLLQKADKVLTKLSPMIDLNYLLLTLPKISHIHLIAVRNEVKEVLIVQEPKKEVKAQIHCVNLETEEPILQFGEEMLHTAKAVYSAPKRYLYIPNNALLKSGGFNYVAAYFGIEKLEVNTHLYTSEELKEPFAGRVLEVTAINTKELKAGSKYCILSKNYPLSVEEIKKKYRLVEGGNEYLIFTRSVGGLTVLLGKVIK
ncbi:class I SAM-dependent methyltransferase [Capnocytophaga sp. oral taxon 878]|uniref:class I SAM-dependent methyltransferase n=1 Tax=Capnocytophaga sp. oral taxon 878 TaxID=1316596 RepID=UPI000D035E4D|nr:class I SAM-dependent methyltransferase [Capnocytophaga sp. oral taxon 878]AVM49702.1 methyltransferase [Capnocytophaga sp. oral taxon 878]